MKFFIYKKVIQTLPNAIFTYALNDRRRSIRGLHTIIHLNKNKTKSSDVRLLIH
jgi:hypothetical protein